MARYGYGGPSYRELTRQSRPDPFQDLYESGPPARRGVSDYIAGPAGRGDDGMGDEVRDLLREGNSEEANRRVQEYMERFANGKLAL